MGPPEKRRRRNTSMPESPVACTLPADLILEIVARTNPSTLVRCAAACKDLHRDILSPSFIRRVTQRDGILPSRFLAYLYTNKDVDAQRPLSLVHPVMPAVVSFCNDRLSPFMSCHTADLLDEYEPMTSRGGLVLLQRRYIRLRENNSRLRENNSNHLCVYDFIMGDRTFFSAPSGISIDWDFITYVLLTAADGIGCPFKLVVADVDSNLDGTGCNIRVLTATSLNVGHTSWGSVTYDGDIVPTLGFLQRDRDGVVLHGSVIHWLVCDYDKILTYNVHKGSLDTAKLPPVQCQKSQRHLGKSPDGKLRLLVADGFSVSFWLQLNDGEWEREAVINVEDKLWSLHPYIPPGPVIIEFEDSGEMSSVVLLRMWSNDWPHGPLIVLDLEMKEMCRQAKHPVFNSLMFEFDLSKRLLANKTFSEVY